MASGQQDTAGGLHLADHMARSRCAQNAILSDNKFFDPIGCPDLCDQLYHFWIVEPAIATDDEKGVLDAFGYGE
jgi:hypothetical protein